MIWDLCHAMESVPSHSCREQLKILKHNFKYLQGAKCLLAFDNSPLHIYVFHAFIAPHWFIVITDWRSFNSRYYVRQNSNTYHLGGKFHWMFYYVFISSFIQYLFHFTPPFSSVMINKNLHYSLIVHFILPTILWQQWSIHNAK